MRTVGELLKKSNLSRIELLQKLPLFTEWPLAQLASLYRNAVKKEYTYSNFVYKQEEVSESIFVILSGEIEVPAAHQILHTEPKPVVKEGLFVQYNTEQSLPLVVRLRAYADQKVRARQLLRERGRL